MIDDSCLWRHEFHTQLGNLRWQSLAKVEAMGLREKLALWSLVPNGMLLSGFMSLTMRGCEASDCNMLLCISGQLSSRSRDRL